MGGSLVVSRHNQLRHGTKLWKVWCDQGNPEVLIIRTARLSGWANKNAYKEDPACDQTIAEYILQEATMLIGHARDLFCVRKRCLLALVDKG